MSPRVRKIIFIVAVILLGVSSQRMSNAPSPAKGSKTSAYVALMSTEPDHLYDVVRTVDGDTIIIKDAALASEKEITVRLLGIDTPETVDPRKAVQCYGKEASARTKELLAHAQVRLVGDSSQTTFDKYDRLLAYVYRADDGLFINKYLIEQGFAHEYTYDVSYAHRDEFRLAEKQAREAGRGLWSPQACK